PKRVMPELVPGIHVFLSWGDESGWPGTSPVMTKSESSRRLRIAPGDEFRHDKAFAASSELHVVALGIGGPAAGRGDERGSRPDVPFAGRAAAGIDVGRPLRDPAEFDRMNE